jgi:hypothetical protein
LNAVDRIAYGNGGTDILAGLQMAINEIKINSIHNQTVIGEYPSYSTSAVESV